MKDNIVEVRLWGRTVGLLSWDEVRRCSIFQFDKDFLREGLDISPLEASISSPSVQRGFPIMGNKERLYSGLPPFIADSLPDRWGNVVFQKWVEKNHLRTKEINSLDRLSFIGKRAMGALEYYPAHIDEDASVNIELASLYELADKLSGDWSSMCLPGMWMTTQRTSLL